MSLSYLVRPKFVPCPSCAVKPGSPDLCRECLERRELYGAVEKVRAILGALPASARTYAAYEATTICVYCGTSPIECQEHG